MAQIVSICNQKGGVGKSTTVFHLSRSAVLRGLRVLVVDADPQGNISRLLSRDPLSEDQVSLADVLLTRVPSRPGSPDPIGIAEVIVPGLWENLDVVPAVGDTLSYARDQLVITGAGREHKLREALEEIQTEYDLIFIDCPPSLDQLPLNALTASSGAMIVTHTRLLSLSGINQLMQTIANVQKYNNPDLRILGITVNHYEKELVASRHWMLDLQQAADTNGWPLLSPSVPKRTLIANTSESGQALDEQGADGAALTRIYDRHLTALLEGAQR